MNILDALTVSDSGVADDQSFSVAKKIAKAGGNIWKDMSLLEKTALTTSPLPVIGDIAGIASDIEMYATKPEERTFGNAILSMAGLIPGIPAASTVRSAAKGAERAMPSTTVDYQGVAAEDIMLAKRLMDTGFLKPESSGKYSEVKKAMKKYNEAMNNPAFAEREALAAKNDFITIFTEDVIPDEKKLDIPSLMGEYITPIKTDRTDLGILDQIGGIPVGTRVDAGDKFSRANQGTDTGWMSMFNTAKTVQNKSKGIREDTDQDPIGINTLMGIESSNFSTAIAEPAMRQIQQLPISKEAKAQFDAELRKKWPDWVGLDSESAMDQLMGRSGFPNVGKNRTKFVETMGKRQDGVGPGSTGLGSVKKYRDQGFPNIQELYFGVMRPEIAGSPMRTTGTNAFRMNAGDARLNVGRHPAYTGEVPGEYIGGGYQVPFELFFPNQYAEQMKRVDKSGNPLTRDQAINAIADSAKGYERVGQMHVDTIMDYLEKTGQL